MPKQMFFNIPIEKQQMILEVAMEEFTSKSFELVSVNSIIKKASISRGSFYTYFTDLDELFNYLFEQLKTERLQYAEKFIGESNGEFFVFAKKLFEYDFDQYRSQRRYSLFRNYIHYIQMSKKGSVKDTIVKGILDALAQKAVRIEQLFDFSKYSIERHELPDLMEMVMLVAVNTFLLSETDDFTKEEIIEIFNKRLNVFQYGILKR